MPSKRQRRRRNELTRIIKRRGLTDHLRRLWRRTKDATGEGRTEWRRERDERRRKKRKRKMQRESRRKNRGT